MRLNKGALDDLLWWQHHLVGWEGRSLLPFPPDVCITTDASKTGWGAFLSTPADPDLPLERAWGFWAPHESSQSSNWREATATLLAMKSFSSHLRGRSLLVRTDNISNVAALTRGGSSSPRLTEIARQVWDLRHGLSLRLTAQHVAGVLNDEADRLSRIAYDKDDWKLHPLFFESVCNLWGTPDTDLFATRVNRQVPRFFSLSHDPESAGTDALLQSWSSLDAYANPPFVMIGAVLHKVRRDQATVRLVLPLWKSATWWPLLLELLADVPRLVPLQEDTFLPGHLGSATGMGLPPWKVLACLVCGNTQSREASLSRRLQLRPPSTAPPRLGRRTPFGGPTCPSARDWAVIPWPPLPQSSLTG